MAPKAAFLEKITLPQKPLKVLFVLPEVSPYATVGGLSYVGGALSKALKKIGVDVKIFMPKFRFLDDKEYSLETVLEGLEVPTGEEKHSTLICNVKSHEDEERIETFFLENMEYYEQRANVYGYHDDPSRFALLSRGALEFLGAHNWTPDIIHTNDWQTGFVPNYLETAYKRDKKLSKIATLFTIHNLNYQGMFDHRRASEMDFDDGKSPIAPIVSSEEIKKQNFLRRGIIYSDVVNTVSETYAREILTPEYGEGLDKLLLELRGKLFGVNNGIDYEKWNPANDPLIVENFDAGSLGKRIHNKIALQKEFGMERGGEFFIMGFVGRMVEQKGADLIGEAIWPFMKQWKKTQLVVIGGGEERFMKTFDDLKEAFPGRVGAHLMFNATLPHLLYAGADSYLAPSRFEPSGLTQLEAMRYGCVPIVRATGGLADSVENFDFKSGTGTGFVFENFDKWEFFGQMVRAFEIFQQPSVWKAIVKRAMEKDFSWKASAQKYLELYRKAIVLHKGEE